MTVAPSSEPERGSGATSTTLPAGQRVRCVALIGNPNTGKTSLFNALTGFHRHVANYPGVTVELARGRIQNAAPAIELLDLPGTYSLAAQSPDEVLVTDALAGAFPGARRPDAVVVIVDASNLARNLYLLSQVLELGLPVVVAVNMVDIARSRGIEVDCRRLAERLGVPVVPVIATQIGTVRPLVAAISEVLNGRADAGAGLRAVFEGAVAEAAARVQQSAGFELAFGEALRALLDVGGAAERRYLARGGRAEVLAEARRRLAEAGVDGLRSEVRARYAWVGQVLDGVIYRPNGPVVSWSDRLDRVLTHKLWGGLVLAAVLFTLFQAIFSWAGPLMEAIDAGFAWLANQVARVLPEGVVRSLLADGLIAGVGGVLVFLPQIMILFAFIAVLEDCGYLARAAYMMDRLMRGMGLSGRAFIPLLSSFACAVPAILGTRTIRDRRERLTTILIAPFMSCSARLPVYVLMISAFVPPTPYLGGLVTLQALVMMGMYLVGVLVAVPLAWLLRRSVLSGAESFFVLELPSYKLPRVRAIWQRMYFAGRNFVMRAGTVILAVNVAVWALGYFPRSAATAAAVRQQAQLEGWDDSRLESELAGAYLRSSYLGRLGAAIEPLVRPIGWDWRIGMATIASFPAREVVIATLGTIFNLGAEQDERSESLRQAVQAACWPDGRPLFTLPVALSLMVFFALCAQCASTLVVMGRETGSWVWPVASFTWMTGLAYLAAWATAAGARAAGL